MCSLRMSSGRQRTTTASIYRWLHRPCFFGVCAGNIGADSVCSAIPRRLLLIWALFWAGRAIHSRLGRTCWEIARLFIARPLLRHRRESYHGSHRLYRSMMSWSCQGLCHHGSFAHSELSWPREPDPSLLLLIGPSGHPPALLLHH